MTIAQLAQRAENAYVGVACGLMDQFASANGVEGHALYFDTRSLDFYPVPLPEGTVIVIADSGVRRTLATPAYNDRRAACEQAVALLKPHLPGIQALRDVTPSDFGRLSHYLPELVARRAQHIVEECARMEEAVVVLKAGDADAFGRLMLAGHASLRDLYEVSCPELDVLVSTASALPGCFGARLTGAGFGGCTVNLVESSQAHSAGPTQPRPLPLWRAMPKPKPRPSRWRSRLPSSKPPLPIHSLSPLLRSSPPGSWACVPINSMKNERRRFTSRAKQGDL